MENRTLKVLGILILNLCIFVSTEKIRFDKYRVYSLAIRSTEEAKLVKELETIGNGYEILNNPIMGQMLDILVPPHKFGEFKEFLQNHKINSIVKINNLQELIDQEEPNITKTTKAGDMDWKSYHTLEEIYDWLDTLLKEYSSVLTPEIVGTSFQGREIRAVKLSHKPGNKAILIEANIHAREWITSATATWVLNSLLKSNDSDAQDIAENVDWYIIPVSNPDGFTYSKTTNRLWRKTRYPHFHLCYGVDGNRNFDIKWNQNGTSNNPCDITYAGPTAFSEPETRALADFYLKHKAEVIAYIAFHSYSQLVLLPYGFTRDRPENYDGMMQVGKAAADAIHQRYQTEYGVGSTSELLYANSGSSRDWATAVHNVSVAYTIEMRDKGRYGFVLPPEQIIPNSEEIFDALKAIVRECRMLGYI